ncbi:unnamed protein product [Adineta steineri]|uniref:RING-type domain-containing protein n=1 Tax=Adineta steineri TaxID=433720 RepID=A0A815AC57_9BILA|nr:unnamed protein product [Adineta steineri]CAF4069129.1 unnamed protein product [Adineta steineri]
MLNKPASVSDDMRLIGTTATLSSYIDHKRRIAYVDTVGYGDVRFRQNQEAFALYFRELVCYTSIRYNWTFLVLRYQQLTEDVLIYIETLENLLGKNVLTRCTLVFTHCTVKNMTLERCLEANKEHEPTINVIKKIKNVIFGNMINDAKSDTDDDEEYTKQSSKKTQKLRNAFMEQMLHLIDNTNNELLKLDKNWFEYYWTKFSLFMAHCHKKISGKKSKLSELYQLSADLKSGANILIYYDECPICLELITEIDGHEPTACKTKCEHIFHHACLRTWLERQDCCPNCNTILRGLPEKKNGRKIWLTEIKEEQSACTAN